jgi:hypothetical protein
MKIGRPTLAAFIGLTFTTEMFATEYRNCLDSSESTRQSQRSKEMQDIYNADQADRALAHQTPETAWPDIEKRDLERRVRVAAIFAEGCFKSAADYSAAAMVFQHGDQPDHFFQTYLWSKRAMELGDSSQVQMLTRGIDRYLVNTNHKQLFATQAFKPFSQPCWCLDPVEKSFSDELRKKYSAMTLVEALSWVDSLNAGSTCEKAKECAKDLQATPVGSVPGLW